ncbi:hypothetical protein JCM1840_007578 [Sporobolomyces johnsonii]
MTGFMRPAVRSVLPRQPLASRTSVRFQGGSAGGHGGHPIRDSGKELGHMIEKNQQVIVFGGVAAVAVGALWWMWAEDSSPAPEGAARGERGGGGPAGGIMHRSNSNEARGTAAIAERGTSQGHLRRRSSSQGPQHSILLLGSDGAASKPASAGMARVSSLTTFMMDGVAATSGRENEKLQGGSVAQGDGTRLCSCYLQPILRRRLWVKLMRLIGAIMIALLAFYILKDLLLSSAPRVASSDSKLAVVDDNDWLSSAVRNRLPILSTHRRSLLFDTLRTVPYPTSSHPRTPPDKERDSLSFADYLVTRLGSHFSFPSVNGIDGEKGSQLWLTMANNASVRMSAAHLVAFVAGLENGFSSLSTPFYAPRSQDNSTNMPSPLGPVSAPYANKDQVDARRVVITICRDGGCMAFCRTQPTRYCFGGYVGGRRVRTGTDKPLSDLEERLAGENGDEVAKFLAMIETLESGRRVFWVDEGTYFREDPVPYLGELSDYDLQVPPEWTTGKPDAGFVLANPTQRVISLFSAILDIALLSSDVERFTWANINLLVDPRGQQRGDHEEEPVYTSSSDSIDDENLFADEGTDDAYGQTEFESSWDGGLDVRVLDRKMFRTNDGKLGRRMFEFEKRKGDQAVYWHCRCCGDLYDNDFIAGALGFHHPSLAYSMTSPSSLPTLPLVLKTPSLRGTPEQLSYTVGLLLQIAHDTGRTFVPPLTGFTLDEEGFVEGQPSETERYTWRMFPLSRRAAHLDPTSPQWLSHDENDKMDEDPTSSSPWRRLLSRRGIRIVEPGYVDHAVALLDSLLSSSSSSSSFPPLLRAGAIKLRRELTSEALSIDLREFATLHEFTRKLAQPFWSTEKVVILDEVDAVRGKEGWGLRDEFQGLGLCQRRGEADADDDDDGGEGSPCTQLCLLE